MHIESVTSVTRVTKNQWKGKYEGRGWLPRQRAYLARKRLSIVRGMMDTSPESNRGQNVQKALDSELARLKAVFGLAGQLRVVWKPKISSNELHGKVEGSTIIIYDADENEALKTLKHEFVEFVLTEEFLTPRIIEAKNHRRADALVDIISSLI